MKQITPHYEDLDQFVGKRLTFERGDTQFTGEVVGLDTSVVTVDPAGAAQPWLIRGETEDHAVIPSDRWTIFEN